MERESLLSLLILLLGGVLLQAFAFWPSTTLGTESARQTERRTAARLWWPVLPGLLGAAWLCGWALSEPDPVPERIGRVALFAVCAPFALVFGRALLRAAWSLLRQPEEFGVSTVGFIRPQVVFSPFLARRLDERIVRAALAHEWSHVCHRDPLRIWLAQLVCDLQWPWPSAQRRLRAWTTALECARDEEARTSGTDGADLAAAVLASVRFYQDPAGRAGTPTRAPPSCAACASLIGEPAALQQRVNRLLQPLPEPRGGTDRLSLLLGRQSLLLLAAALLSALVLGIIFGERLMHPLLVLLA